MQFVSHCYKPETPAFPLCHPTCEPDVAALANRSSRTLCPLVRMRQVCRIMTWRATWKLTYGHCQHCVISIQFSTWKLDTDHTVLTVAVGQQARNQGGGGVRLVRTIPPPPRDHVGPLGPFFLYVFRKLDCHNFSLLFKLHEIWWVDSQ